MCETLFACWCWQQREAIFSLIGVGGVSWSSELGARTHRRCLAAPLCLCRGWPRRGRRRRGHAACRPHPWLRRLPLLLWRRHRHQLHRPPVHHRPLQVPGIPHRADTCRAGRSTRHTSGLCTRGGPPGALLCLPAPGSPGNRGPGDWGAPGSRGPGDWGAPGAEGSGDWGAPGAEGSGDWGAAGGPGVCKERERLGPQAQRGVERPGPRHPARASHSAQSARSGAGRGGPHLPGPKARGGDWLGATLTFQGLERAEQRLAGGARLAPPREGDHQADDDALLKKARRLRSVRVCACARAVCGRWGWGWGQCRVGLGLGAAQCGGLGWRPLKDGRQPGTPQRIAAPAVGVPSPARHVTTQHSTSLIIAQRSAPALA